MMQEYGISYDSLSLETKDWLNDCKDFEDSMAELNKMQKESEEREEAKKTLLKKRDGNKYKLLYKSNK
jgi:hypothetical protein